MDALLSYSLSDLLLFSEQTFIRQFALYKQWLGPFAYLGYLYATLFLFAWLRQRVHLTRLLALVTAILWLVCIIGFLRQFYAQINWMVGYLVPMLVLQVALLLWIAFKASEVTPSFTALALWTIGLIQVFVELASGRTVETVSVYALTPDSLSICSLALMFLLRQPAWFFAPSLLWLLFSTLTYIAMENVMRWYLVFSLVVITSAMAIRRHSHPQTKH